MTKLPLLNNSLVLLTGVLLLVCINTSAASIYQSMAALADEVNSELVNYYTNIDRFNDVTIETTTPDYRLKLENCDGELSIKTPNNYSGGRITSQVKCNGNLVNWSLYLVSQVQLFAEVLVAKTPLFRGQIIDVNDVELALTDVSALANGYLSSDELAVGKEIKRTLQIGDQIRAQWLLEPKAIKRGEQVTIIARSSQVAVEAFGTALSDGRLGDQIRVRNDRSDRIVRGVVSGERVVSIAF